MSIGSLIEGSPCVRVDKEKRLNSNFKGLNLADRLATMREVSEEPDTLPRIVEKPSFASTSSFQFGNDRMEQARKGMLKRESLEIGCLSAEGEDTSTSCTSIGFVSDPPLLTYSSASEQTSTFRRPIRASRARSNTYASSGAETPPLSAADNSSVSGSSESSIDVSHLTMLLANVTHPAPSFAAARARARGHGHRRRISQARASRSSVYETIEEEDNSVVLGLAPRLDDIAASPVLDVPTPIPDISNSNQSVIVVDSDADSPRSSIDWDPNHGISLRRYYALKDEAHDTVEESKRVWIDTPFSVFALQCKSTSVFFPPKSRIISPAFNPPRHPDGMKAMLEHSQRNYMELPPALRAPRVRSRTSSRASPYVRAAIAAGVSPSSLSSHSRESSISSITEVLPSFAARTTVLQPVVVHTNMASPAMSVKSAKGKKATIKPREDALEKDKNATIRPRVNSSARRSALGWVKRGPKSSGQKENTSAGSLMK
jgi:serine/arginine repetitive matrix protein 2